MTDSAIQLAKNPGSDGWEALGLHTFVVLPRIGDHIERELDGHPVWYRVVAFTHPSTPKADAGNIYAIHVGTMLDAQRAIFAES